MKYIAIAVVLTLSSVLIAQNETNMPAFTNNNYEAEWKLIDSLEQQGLPESALKEVEKLYVRAKSENNPTQIVKTLIYQQKYRNQLEEDGEAQSIRRLQQELSTADFPVKPILQSILAELYHSYWQQYRWTIQERTSAEMTPEDVQTWSAEQLLAESARLYLASLEDPRTRQTPLTNFDAITVKGENSEGLWPTLYDLLIHRAIEHFSNETSYLNQPAYRFVLDQPEVFADAATFVNTTFTTKDTAALKYRALLLFQQVLRHHLNDADPKALIDADLKRLQFVYNGSVLLGKDDLYLKTLEALRNRHRRHPSAAEVGYQIALHHYQKGNEYNWSDPATETYRLRYKAAKAFCEEVIKEYPNAFGANQCAALQSEILQKSLSLQAEAVNLPNQAMLAQLQYRNVPEAFFRVVQLSEQDLRKIEGLDYEQTLAALLKLKKIREWSVKLPDDGDFQMHATEIVLDGLPLGQYGVLASDNRRFQSKSGAVGYLMMQVSNLAYFQKKFEDDSGFELVIVHRNTGEPLAGIEAEFFAIDYDGRRNQPTRRSLLKIRSDAQGFVRPKLQEDFNISVELAQGKDKLYGDRSLRNFSYYWQPERHTTTETHFFLDRKIYRPGQTIYFKALVLEKDADEMPRIAANRNVTITFYDVNYQEINKVQLRTNEFGTVNGSFIAPRSGLLGQMRIKADTDIGETYFNVEEYKRPKFEVVMQPIEKGYALGDTAQVRGVAKAYAGSNVDGATVRYRVTREVQYPWMPWWFWRRGGFPMRSEITEIAYGETTTDANGEFTVSFAALPDLTVAQDRNPMFVFKVTADVIDITGETHSDTKMLNLGYLTLQANLDIREKIDRTTPATVKISATNLDGQPEPARGTITIHRLQAPQRTFIERYWERPDRPVLSKDQFYKIFPNFAYADEDEPQNWTKAAEVYTADFNTQNSDSLLLNLQNQPVGHYSITLATQDGNGKPITVTKFFALYDAPSRQIPAHTLQWSLLNKERFEPGEQMQLPFATSATPLHILYEQSNRTSYQNARWLRVNGWEWINYEVTEADRGNFSYTWNAVCFNRVFSEQQFVQVPWSNKDLRIAYSTFRDKLRPGQEEEWRITISGSQRERVAAEMVAAMYDASLDALAPANSWSQSFYPMYYYSRRGIWSPQLFSTNNLTLIARDWQKSVSALIRTYPALNWFGYYRGSFYRDNIMLQMRAAIPPGAPAMEMATPTPLAETVVTGYGAKKDAIASTEPLDEKKGAAPPQPVRKNLKETVFFLPELRTDAEGNVIIKFTMNEALTRWKFLTFVHTKDLQFAASEREVVTQKELMVLPNPPRFMREGDELYFTAKVSNLSEQTLSGKIRLELFDAATMQPVASKLGLSQTELDFSAAAGQSDGASWRLRIPVGELTALTWRVTAQAGNFSDGEENTLPILTNRMLVTETLPMALRSGQTKEFTLQNLRSNTSPTLAHHAMTLEFTSNPAWYAVQALPYLMEYPYDCTEQIFNRYYANALAASVANATPKIRQIFERWKGTDALESNLTKNQELKSALLAETPWVLDAQNEAQQRKNIGVLFDLLRLSEEQTATLNKLAEQQLPNGGFSWFPGGRANWYITQYIVEGFGHLEKLGAGKLQDNPTAYQIIGRSIQFIDNELADAYSDLEKLVKEGKAKWEDDHLSHIAIHYLYARSFFRQFPVENAAAKKAGDYYLGQAEKYWLNKGFYQEGLLALALHRYGKAPAAEKIVRSLRERALRNEELGMYWKYNAGYYWHQMPIESQALMIEVFAEVAKDNAAIDEMRIWLLKNKQTNSWPTTKATAAAVYALLVNGSEWLSDTRPVDISFPNLKKRDRQAAISAAQQSAEPGTGYFKTAWEGSAISAGMATVKVSNPNKTVAWGGLYWQYFENLDKIKTFQETPLKIVKQVFRSENTDRGPVLKNITAKDPLRPGDKLIVRIELRADREMEFIHLKDMRASGLEPLNVLSGYRWQGGLGYYESTRDVATDFFIDYLPRGTYVFEYPVRVVHEGDFFNGITSIQCMYAPEFSSHSEGIRLKVNK